MIEDLNMRQSINLSEESVWEKLQGTLFGYDFLDMIPKHRQQKIKLGKLDFIRIKFFN